MKINVLIFLPLVCLFQSCSWQEYFVVINETKSDIVVEYEVEIPPSGFPIFTNQPRCFSLNSERLINWNETSKTEDLDTAKHLVKICLAPNKGLIIGELSNDYYTSFDQYFINGRYFNLKNLTINYADILTEINPKNFDNFFIKHKKMIEYRVKK